MSVFDKINHIQTVAPSCVKTHQLFPDLLRPTQGATSLTSSWVSLLPDTSLLSPMKGMFFHSHAWQFSLHPLPSASQVCLHLSTH